MFHVKRPLEEPSDQEFVKYRKVDKQVGGFQNITLGDIGKWCIEDQSELSYSNLRQHAKEYGLRQYRDYDSKQNLCDRFSRNLGFPVDEIKSRCESLSDYQYVIDRVNEL